MKTALDECREDALHYHTLWKNAEIREAQVRAESRDVREAWETLVAILPTLGEWERGAALARDGKLIDWVLRQRRGE